MQAPHPEASRLSINFGEKHGAGTPLDLELVIDLFSLEQEHIRQSLASSYHVQIPSTCIAFELVVQEGSAKQKAQSLAQIQQKLSIFQQIPNSFTTHHHGNRVLGLIEAPEFSDMIKSYEEHFISLKEESQKQSHPISMRIYSNNDLGKVGETYQKQGYTAWMDSLHYEFGFVKNEFITKVLLTFCEKILEDDRFSSMIRAFKRLNLELNFTSSNFLRQFQKIKTGQKSKIPRSDLTQFLEEAGIERGRLFILNPTVFVKGDFLATGLAAFFKKALE